jgi:hypothetical protein
LYPQDFQAFFNSLPFSPYAQDFLRSLVSLLQSSGNKTLKRFSSLTASRRRKRWFGGTRRNIK